MSYNDKLQELCEKRAEAVRWRNAQDKDHPNFRKFQEQIHTITDEFLAWQKVIPHLEKVDEEIKVRERLIKRMRSDADAVFDRWKHAVAGWALLFLAAFIVLAVLGYMWVLLVVALVGCAGVAAGLIIGLSHREAAYDETDDLEDEIEQLQKHHGLLTPSEDEAAERK